MPRKTTFQFLILALFITLNACTQTPPAPVVSDQLATPETPSQNLPTIIFPEKEEPSMSTSAEASEQNDDIPDSSFLNSRATQEESTDVAEFETTVNQDGTVTIKRYLGPGGDVVIPPEIDGRQVTAIGNTFEITGAFQDCTTVTSVAIPEGVTEIQDNAFYSCTALEIVTIPASVTLLRNCAFCDCPNLRAVYFEGDAPQQANYVFDSTENVTMYYRDGASGWSSLWHGRPAETY